MALYTPRGFRRPRDRVSGLLFDFGIDDTSLVTASGHTLTFDRDSGRSVIDGQGRVVSLARDQVPWSSVYNATDLVWEPTLDCHRAGTNLVLQSESLGTAPWASVGAPTLTAAAKRCGDLVLDLLNDTSAAALQGKSQVITFTGNAAKGLVLHMAAGTSTSTVVRVRDTTNAADRLLAVVTWASGVPTVTMTTGTSYGFLALADGTYQFHFRTTSGLLAAATNQLEVYPASTSALAVANTGSVYVGGVQAQNQEYCTAYLKTGAATYTSDDDLCTATLVQPVADFTVYARVARPVRTGAATGTAYTCMVAHLGTGGISAGYWTVQLDPLARTISATISDGTTPTAVAASLPATNMFDVCIQFNQVASAARVRIDATGAGFGAYSATTGAVAAWYDSTLAIGSSNAIVTALDAGLRRLRVATGARTLAQMKGLLA